MGCVQGLLTPSSELRSPPRPHRSCLSQDSSKKQTPKEITSLSIYRLKILTQVISGGWQV